MRILLLCLYFFSINCLFAQDNQTLKNMFDEDQGTRLNDKIDWKILLKQDSVRRSEVQVMINQNKLLTTNDYYRAAMIFQHGTDSVSYKMAMNLSKKAYVVDTSNHFALLLTVTSLDRYLLSIGKPQIYGTQFMIRENKWYLRDFDTTIVTDNERKRYGAKTLNEIKEYLKKKNGEDKGLLFYPKK